MEPLEVNAETNEKRAFWKDFFADLKQAVKELLNMEEEYEEDNIDKAIKDTELSEEEAKKIGEALSYEQEKLEKQATDRFEDFKFEINDPEKDEDGFNKIPDHVTEQVKAQVSEEKAKAETKGRAKGGKEKTRVDED